MDATNEWERQGRIQGGWGAKETMALPRKILGKRRERENKKFDLFPMFFLTCFEKLYKKSLLTPCRQNGSSPGIMVLILYGNSEISAHVRSNLYNLTC